MSAPFLAAEPGALTVAITSTEERADRRSADASAVRGSMGSVMGYGLVGSAVMLPFDGALELVGQCLQAETRVWNRISDEVRRTRRDFAEADAAAAAQFGRVQTRVAAVVEEGW